MTIDLAPHKFTKNENTGQTELAEVKHYMALRREPTRENPDGGQYFLQGGKVFAGEGEEEIALDAAPDWVRKHVEGMTPEARKAYGFVNKGGRPPTRKETANGHDH